MITLGTIQTLRIKRITKVGAFLNEEIEEGEDILLPLNQLTRDMTTNDEVRVFIYRDSDDRIISTTKPVKVTLGQTAVLKVVDVNDIGAFLDWGLEKNLFLPYKEQIGKVSRGNQVLIALYIDGTERLCATMNVYEALSNDSPYKENDRVKGTLYQIHPQYGAFVAVDNLYHGLIPMKELYGNYKEGSVIEARVKNVKQDGKLELSIRDAAHFEMAGDSDKILQVMRQRKGKLSLHDKSDPEDIKHELNMSKAAFKRAIGKLYKEGIITISEQGIELID